MPNQLMPGASRLIDRALEEDLGAGDLTSDLLFTEDRTAQATIVAKGHGILAGIEVAEATFGKVDPGLAWRAHRHDGDPLAPGDTVAEIQGSVRAILRGERVALNFLQRLSGIATFTGRFVKAVDGLDVKILDTRKTAPGLRVFDKYAVRVGGGFNHRFGLFDGILIKDNHIRAASGVIRAVQLARQKASPMLKVEVEVESLAQVGEALEAGADIIMLDNMDLAGMTKAVELIAGRAVVEASGGVSLQTVRDIATTGVNCISVGALTHSVKALDLSLEVR